MHPNEMVVTGAFAAGVFVALMFALTASAMFPSEHRPAVLRGWWGGTVFWLMIAVVAGLAMRTAWFAVEEVRWYFALVVAGLIVLFAPGLHDMLGRSLREGAPGLALAALLNVGLHGMIWSLTLP